MLTLKHGKLFPPKKGIIKPEKNSEMDIRNKITCILKI